MLAHSSRPVSGLSLSLLALWAHIGTQTLPQIHELGRLFLFGSKKVGAILDTPNLLSQQTPKEVVCMEEMCTFYRTFLKRKGRLEGWLRDQDALAEGLASFLALTLGLTLSSGPCGHHTHAAQAKYTV